MPVTGSPRQGTREAVRSAPPKAPSKVPSWGLVLATTARLWWQRRLHDLRRPGRILVAVVGVAVLAAAAIVAVILTRSPASPAPAAHASSPARPKVAAHAGTAHPGAGTRATTAAQTQAAMWSAGQLSAGQAIACDPGMCTALADHGVARSRLRPAASLASAPAADVIAASATDAGLAQDAPVLLASFGSGPGEVQVRAPDKSGAAAYRAALRSDLTARRSAGTQLLHSGRIQATAAGAAQLRAGQVDARMLVTLALLASQRSWRVVAFGSASPGVPATAAPLRQAVLVATGAKSGAAALAGALALARGQHGAYRAAQVATVKLPGGQTGISIGFAAPSPLGLLAGASG